MSRDAQISSLSMFYATDTYISCVKIMKIEENLSTLQRKTQKR